MDQLFDPLRIYFTTEEVMELTGVPMPVISLMLQTNAIEPVVHPELVEHRWTLEQAIGLELAIMWEHEFKPKIIIEICQTLNSEPYERNMGKRLVVIDDKCFWLSPDLDGLNKIVADRIKELTADKEEQPITPGCYSSIPVRVIESLDPMFKRLADQLDNHGKLKQKVATNEKGIGQKRRMF